MQLGTAMDVKSIEWSIQMGLESRKQHNLGQKCENTEKSSHNNQTKLAIHPRITPSRLNNKIIHSTGQPEKNNVEIARQMERIEAEIAAPRA